MPFHLNELWLQYSILQDKTIRRISVFESKIGMSFYGKYLPLNFFQIVKQIGGVIVSSKRKQVGNIELSQYIKPYKNYAFR